MRNRRHARNALLYGLGGFVLLQLALVVLLAWLMPWLRDPMHGLKEDGLRHRLATAPPGARSVVMIGSSRTAFGLDAELVSTRLSSQQGRPVVVYNFGLHGAGPCATLLSFRRLLEDGIRPDLLLIEVLPFRLGENLAVDLDETYLPTVALRYDELPLVQRLAGRQRRLSRFDWWLGWCVPCYHHRFALVSHAIPTLLHYLDRANRFQAMDRSGWVPLSATAARPRQVMERGNWQDNVLGLHDFRSASPAAIALEEILRMARAHDIRTAIVFMPERSDLRSCYDADVLKKVKLLLDRLVHGYDFALIDARDWIGEDGFRDAHHLVSAGAVQFSDRLAREELPALLEVRREAATGRRVAGAGE